MSAVDDLVLLGGGGMPALIERTERRLEEIASGHGEALADEIPDARLFTLEGAGHGVDRADWQAIVGAIIEHTDRASG